MSEETSTAMPSVDEPPKANPLAKPAAASGAPLGPAVKKPVIGGASQGALKPGLKLPPKPGLAGGLKLPPKPASPLKTVSTASPLKPGLKMPAAPALKSGLKLPTKPVIRKPGSGLTPVKPQVPSASVPKGDAVSASPVSAVAPTPAEEPVSAAAAPAETVKPAPVGPAAKVEKPVAAAGDALSTLKTITKNLKSLTSPIPQQAILRKTGIIADQSQALTDAQKQAAKSKTSRISLADAVGAAPVKNDGAPMKTIRIKRPVDLPLGGPGSLAPSAKKATAKIVEPPPSVVNAEPSAPQAGAEVSATQRKTLKISRPSGGTMRPAGRFGVKKPALSAAPAVNEASDQPGAEVAHVADIADIPDMPAMPVNVSAFASSGSSNDTVADVPAAVATLGLVAQLAACVAMGALVWFLYQDSIVRLF